jgi:hypothetical protein
MTQNDLAARRAADLTHMAEIQQVLLSSAQLVRDARQSLDAGAECIALCQACVAESRRLLSGPTPA